MLTRVLLMIVGPTAVGKTAISIQLAQHFGTEIVSADARQVYQGMPIGTAQPTADERRVVNHHLVDFLPVVRSYDVKQFEHDALSALSKIHRRRKIALATGGSGLYVKTLVSGIDDLPEVSEELRSGLQQRWQHEGLSSLLVDLERVDPAYFAIVDRQNHRRVLRALEIYHSTGRPYSTFRRQSKDTVRPFHTLMIGLRRARPLLYERINQRVDRMIDYGLVEEAQALLPYRNYQALRTVGYQELFSFFDGQYDLTETRRLIQRNTRRYAKRQLTWFSKDETIRWFDLEAEEDRVTDNIISYVENTLSHRL